MFIKQDYEDIKKEMESRKKAGHSSVCFYREYPYMAILENGESRDVRISDEIIDQLEKDGHEVLYSYQYFDGFTIVKIRL